MGIASLGFDKGPSILFRIDPNDISWNFRVNTAVMETVGGRVVQVLGATLSDITVKGSFGEKKSTVHDPAHMVSWEMAEAFVARIRDIITFQSSDSSIHAEMQRAAVFSYPPKGWRFSVYVKAITDGSSPNAVTHSPGHFSYDYSLILFIVTDLSQAVVKAGTNNGVLNRRRQQAIQDYINRLTAGIGWRETEFNGPNGVTVSGQGAPNPPPTPPPAKPTHGAQGGRTSSP